MISVIFDMDGTLLDTQSVFVPVWDKAGEAQGFKNLGRCIPDVCGKNDEGWMAYLREKFPTMDVEKFRADAQRLTEEMMVVRYKKGAKELLDFLKSKGVKIALASGSSHNSINHHLNEVGATHYFDVIVGGMDVANGKPAPDIFLLAAEKLGVKPETCIVIEDSENGIKAGVAAGMRCIGVPDVVGFSAEVKNILFAEFCNLSEALPIFIELLEQE